MSRIIDIIIDIIDSKALEINKWIDAMKLELPAIFYNSIDIRNSGYKMAPVDVNFFPAGFNNIAYEGQVNAAAETRKFIEE